MQRIKAGAAALILLGIAAAAGFHPGPLRGETVDGIVAVVNAEIITLTDLRVAAAFGLYPGADEDPGPLPLRGVLDRAIDLKLVLGLAGAGVTVTRQALDAAVSGKIQELGRDEFRRRLDRFDMSEQDLRVYLEDFLVYGETISRRFNRGAFINLREIEEYYRERYVPAQEARGDRPKRLTEVLEEIETELREEKRRGQISEWLRQLRLETEIRLFMDLYPEFFRPTAPCARRGHGGGTLRFAPPRDI